MPSPGRAISAGTATLAVGKPELGAAPAVAADHRAPDLVGPARGGPRPPPTSPCGHQASRMRVDETGLGRPAASGPRRRPRSPRPPPARAGGPRCPCGRDRSGSPPPPPPGGPRGHPRGSRPRTPRPSRRPGPGRRAPPRVRSIPQASSSSSFWARSVSSGGADSGRTTVAGWRSKVTTARAGRVGGLGRQLGQEVPVSEVDAVVGADRHRRAPDPAPWCPRARATCIAPETRRRRVNGRSSTTAGRMRSVSVAS